VNRQANNARSGPARAGLFCSAALAVALSGCCVCHDLSIKNETGSFVTAAAKDTGRGAGIPTGKRRDLPFIEGPMVVMVGSNMWFYPKIAYREHPEATHRHFRFGICQAGFGYFRTYGTLEADGRLIIGRGVYEAEARRQW
jgi:hypothetical protein